jgi:hypothetical protein
MPIPTVKRPSTTSRKSMKKPAPTDVYISPSGPRKSASSTAVRTSLGWRGGSG